MEIELGKANSIEIIIRTTMDLRRERMGREREEEKKRREGNDQGEKKKRSLLPSTTLGCEKDSWLSLTILFSLSSIVIAILTMHIFDYYE